MCSYTTPGRRFDPALCEGNCPECGAIVGPKPGKPTPTHQPQGSRSKCPGSGRPAK